MHESIGKSFKNKSDERRFDWAAKNFQNPMNELSDGVDRNVGHSSGSATKLFVYEFVHVVVANVDTFRVDEYEIN